MEFKNAKVGMLLRITDADDVSDPWKGTIGILTIADSYAGFDMKPLNKPGRDHVHGPWRHVEPYTGTVQDFYKLSNVLDLFPMEDTNV